MGDVLSAEGLARFGEVAASHVGDDGVPGLVALVASGDEVHVETQGVLSLGGPSVERSSQFRIASTTKPITGAATLALVGEGLFGLHDPVDKWLPELADRRVLRRIDGPLDETVPSRRPITVRDLLTFTFGFGMCFEMFMSPAPWPVVQAANELHLATLGPPDPAEQPDPDVWISAFGSLPLMAQPGERWLYNTGASVLGVLLSRAAGISFAEVLRTRIFEPLKMADTAFCADDPRRLATAYAPTEEGLVVWDPPDGKWSHPPAFGDGGAGLVSTVDDLLAFSRMLLRGGDPVISPELVRAMTSDQLTAAQKTTTGGFLEGRSWGFSTSVITEGARQGAFGWDGGLGTSWLVDPACGLAVIVLTQRLFESPQPPLVHQDLRDAAYAALGRG